MAASSVMTKGGRLVNTAQLNVLVVYSRVSDAVREANPVGA